MCSIIYNYSTKFIVHSKKYTKITVHQTETFLYGVCISCMENFLKFFNFLTFLSLFLFYLLLFLVLMVLFARFSILGSVNGVSLFTRSLKCSLHPSVIFFGSICIQGRSKVSPFKWEGRYEFKKFPVHKNVR